MFPNNTWLKMYDSLCSDPDFNASKIPFTVWNKSSEELLVRYVLGVLYFLLITVEHPITSAPSIESTVYGPNY